MTDSKIKKLFPWGVTVIPRREEMTSYPAVVGAPDDADGTFSVWDNPYHSIELSTDLTVKDDGYVTKGPDGQTYFLRPLTKDARVKF